MKTMAKFGFVALLLLGVAAVAPVAVAEGEIGIETTEGQIHEIDYGTLTTLISGVTYRFAIDAKVSIAGSFGAPTLLQPGMNVSFTFRRYADGDREIIELAELPPGREPTLY
jgi:hypothetical protein